MAKRLPPPPQMPKAPEAKKPFMPTPARAGDATSLSSRHATRVMQDHNDAVMHKLYRRLPIREDFQPHTAEKFRRLEAEKAEAGYMKPAVRGDIDLSPRRGKKTP